MANNPWQTMWAYPRETIKTIIKHNPRYGIRLLSFVYILKTSLFLSNYWSLGLTFSFYTILPSLIVLSFILWPLWLSVTAFIAFNVGKILKGQASYNEVRASLAWSKIPSFLGIFGYFVLFMFDPRQTFILQTKGIEVFFLVSLNVILAFWCFVLFMKSLKEVQNYSYVRAFVNTISLSLINFVFWFLLVLSFAAFV